MVVSFAPCACLRRAAVPALTVRSFSAVIVRADRLQAPVAMAASTATMLTVSAQPRAIECRLLAMLLLSGLLLAASLCFSSDRLSYSACPPLPVFYSFLFVQTSSRASSAAASAEAENAASRRARRTCSTRLASRFKISIADEPRSSKVRGECDAHNGWRRLSVGNYISGCAYRRLPFSLALFLVLMTSPVLLFFSATASSVRDLQGQGQSEGGRRAEVHGMVSHHTARVMLLPNRGGRLVQPSLM